ncbi:MULTISPECIES: NUDIX domain-containing protein [Pantoea]|jgi:nudix-type nucleoside diphosphatase (YffH/AdpP family)|nr:NUDIX domain-containing protein [Pantoea ananatis]AVG78916.1 NUDIX domain-containing protein [Pantoea ananatis]MCW0350893.1 GDP-mannose pyrophosphatase NudK [Pantoea ananatis]MDC7872075.1 GDP-mannose pyrophosphatase [Pantoea ananatis]PQK69967.1 GDP-mannose pyrophosphatase [Pantoea ananatis]PQK82974.1 GDP-mannose pyrophosphatase [Pantoea ananatis]
MTRTDFSPAPTTASINQETVLAHDWGKLTKYDMTHVRSDGSEQRFTREAYDRGHGATILLYNRDDKSIILTSQFRMPAFLTGHHYELIEACAGLLDERDAVQAIRTEAEEETGYKLGEVTKIGEIFMSPGSVTERLHFFIAPFTREMRVNEGGGVAEEGEDIKVLEIPMRTALDMIDNGQIIDGKTIILIQHLVIKGICTP